MMHKVFTVNTLRRYHKLWFRRKAIETHAMVGKCTQFPKFAPSNYSTCEKAKDSQRGWQQNKFDLELFSYWCYLIYIYLHFLSLIWATLKGCPFFQRERSCVYMILSRTIIKKMLFFQLCFEDYQRLLAFVNFKYFHIVSIKKEKYEVLLNFL